MNAWVRPLRAANIRKRSNGLTNACRHPSPKIKNEPSRGRQPRSPRSFRAHKRVNVGQRGIATTRDREVRANGGERERTLASTIFSHNGGVSCRENYDTVSSMQKKKKKKRERKKKGNAKFLE